MQSKSFLRSALASAAFRRFFFRCTLACVIIQAQAFPQTAVPQVVRRPKIGLALSGGGALGLAHVGVLRYFEEHHIPVDAIAGTSMGGLVGGLYATGLRAEALQKIASDAEWNALLRASPKYEDRPIAEKQSWMRTGSGVTLRLNRNLTLPTGLNSGQRLALFLSRYTAAYSDLSSFDDLPIPFRCVATDLIQGEPLILGRGNLPIAMRATMAVPGEFTPVKMGDRLLVDGGVFDNIPTDALQQMNVDVTIAVSLQVTHPAAKDLNSLTGILKQLMSVVVIANEKRGLERADLEVAVPLQAFDSADFERADEIIQAGYKAAQAMSVQLKKYEADDADWGEYVRIRDRRIRTSPQQGGFIRVASNQADIQSLVHDELRRKLPSKVDTDQLEGALNGITAAASLPGAYYAWEEGARGDGFAVTLQDRSGGGVFIRPSVLLQASGGQPTHAALRLSSVDYFKDAYKERLLAEMTIGYDPGLRFEYYNPIRSEPFFFAPGFLMQRTAIPFSSANGISDLIRDRFAGTFYAGLGTWRFIQWRAGVTAGFDRASAPVTFNGVTSQSTTFANLESNVLYDTQDAETIPTRGQRLDAQLGFSLREHSYPYLNADYSLFLPVHNRTEVFVLGTGATSFGRNLGYYDLFTAGGLHDLPAYRFDEFHANTIASGGGGLAIPIQAERLAFLRPAVAIWHQVGRLDIGARGWETHQSTSAGLFTKTPLGPAGVVLSSTEDGRLRLQLVFGRF